MKNKLRVKKSQIVSNPLVEIRSEFKLLPKALKVVTSFTSETPDYLVIVDNAIYLCWGTVPTGPSAKKFIETNKAIIDDLDEEISYKELGEKIQDIIENELDVTNESLEEKDEFDEYSEDCYLGARLTTNYYDDNIKDYRISFYSFCKIVPSWITVEK